MTLFNRVRYRVAILCLIYVSLSIASVADELPYDAKTISSYIETRSGVYLAIKVGGNLKFNEYKNYMKDYILDEELLINSWKNASEQKGEKFLILKNYKGLINQGSIIWADNLSHYGVTELGKKYILLLTAHVAGESSSYSYGECDVFEFDKIPGDIKNELSPLINYISSSKLNPCLYGVNYMD